jgi:hypothetical protein
MANMIEGFSQEAETAGLALAGQTLGVGILSRLFTKGLLSEQEVLDVIEGALSTLEDTGEDDEATRAARIILDGIAQAFLTYRTEPKAQ